MKSVKVEMKKNAINERLDPKQELQKAEMAVAIAQRKDEEERQHEAEMAFTRKRTMAILAACAPSALRSPCDK